MVLLRDRLRGRGMWWVWLCVADKPVVPVFSTDFVYRIPSGCGDVDFADDGVARTLVESVYGNVNCSGVELGDLYRYAKVYTEGGVYLDTDTNCVVPPSGWLATWKLTGQFDLIVGVEFYKPLQFVQWAFQGKRHSVVLQHVIETVKGRLELYAPGADPIQRTGPGVWTLAILKMLRDAGVERPYVSDHFARVHSFEYKNSSVRIAMLPYRAFGYHGFHGPRVKECCKRLVTHNFRGSWK